MSTILSSKTIASAKKESEKFLAHCEALANGRKEIDAELEQAHQEHILECNECCNKGLVFDLPSEIEQVNS